MTQNRGWIYESGIKSHCNCSGMQSTLVGIVLHWIMSSVGTAVPRARSMDVPNGVRQL